jgi:hypothetical protein
MTATPRSRWLRFSLRGLIVLTTVACMYFACWIPTKTTGVVDVIAYFSGKYQDKPAAHAVPVAPLLLRVTAERSDLSGTTLSRVKESAYCFWILGATVEVPFTATSTTTSSMTITLPSTSPIRRVRRTILPVRQDSHHVMPPSLPSPTTVS